MKSASLIAIIAVATVLFLFTQKQVIANDDSSFDTLLNRCGAYVKPAACNAQPRCVWRGSCVPK